MSGHAQPIPFALFSGRLLELYQPPIRTPSTRHRMKQLLGILGTLGAETTADFTTSLVARFIAARSDQVRRNTVIGELAYLRSAFNFAVEEGFLERSPFASRRL